MNDIELFLWLNEHLKGWVIAKRKEEKIAMKKGLEISKSRSIEVSGNDCGAYVAFLFFVREN